MVMCEHNFLGKANKKYSGQTTIKSAGINNCGVSK